MFLYNKFTYRSRSPCQFVQCTVHIYVRWSVHDCECAYTVVYNKWQYVYGNRRTTGYQKLPALPYACSWLHNWCYILIYTNLRYFHLEITTVGSGGGAEWVSAAAEQPHHQGIPRPHQVQDPPLHPQPQGGQSTIHSPLLSDSLGDRLYYVVIPLSYEDMSGVSMHEV